MGKYMPLINVFLLVWLSTHCKLKWKSKIYKLEKVDGIISILQLEQGAKSKTQVKPRYDSKNAVLKHKLGSRLD